MYPKRITEITSTKKQTAERLRLAPYCRVSSDSTDQLHSFAAQIRYYSDYAKKHPEYQLVDIYADEGITGTEMKKRDELNRLIADCRKGKVDRIIVKSVSRLARNTEELLVLLRMCKEIGASVYFEEQGIDTEKLNMEMIVTFPGMAAQQESVNISGNLRWSYQKRMQSGDFNCTCPAYGFNLKDGELVINETEAAVIRRIFDLYLQGYGTLAIAKMLNEDGIPRKHGYEKWLPSSINYVLNNERYMGDALLQKSYTTETLPFRKMKNDGRLPQYYVENSNPAIVSRETFQAAQNLLRSRKTERCKRKSYPLTGKLRCPECGRVFRHQVVNGKAHWIGSCRSSGATDCQHRHVREDIVYDIFTDMVIKPKTYRGELLGTLIHQMETMQDRTSRNQERLQQIDKEIADLGAKNHIIARLHTSGAMNAADYAMQTSEIGNRLTELRIERRQKLTEDEDDQLLATLKDLNGILDEYEPTVEFDNGLFDEIVAASDAVTLEAIAEKLEVINLQLARRKAARLRIYRWLCIALCVGVVLGFVFLAAAGSPYLNWNDGDTETAVFAAAYHLFEYVFVRAAPFLLLGGVVGIILTYKKG